MSKYPNKPLTAIKVKKLSEPGKYAAGDQVYLKVTRNSNGQLSKRFYWRGTIRTKRCELTIGPFPHYSLSEARAEGQEWTKLARRGTDPRQLRDKNKIFIPNFKEIAEQYIEEVIKPGRGNSKHKKQWQSSMENYVYPKIGNKPVNQITHNDVVRLLQTIWLEKNETARRVKQRIRRIYEWARKRAEWGIGDSANPASDLTDSLPKVDSTSKKHFAAMPYKQIASFMIKLDNQEGISAIALKFLILTAARTGEVRYATWNEIDWEKRVWTIPATRMKARKEHQVPLSDEVIILLKSIKSLSDLYIFESPTKRDAPLSDGALAAVLKRMGLRTGKNKITVHGFRSTFRVWAEEKTDYPHEVKESALAHTIKNKAEAAYQRTSHLDKRRPMMQDWSNYLMAASNSD